MPLLWSRAPVTLVDVVYRSRHLLAENLRLLMRARPGLGTTRAVVAASGGRISKGTMDRLPKATAAATLDTLDELAAVFDVSAYALISPGLAGNHQALTDDAREIAEDYDRLTPDRRAIVRAQIDLILSGSAPSAAVLRRAADRMQDAASAAADDQPGDVPPRQPLKRR